MVKENVIKANTHKYSVSAMCKVLQISRSIFYYEAKARTDESELVADIVDIFKASLNNYGTRKIKAILKEKDVMVSRCRIGRIMKKQGLISNYTTANFGPLKDTCNESKVENVVNRQFDKQPFRNIVVSDLTYVRIGSNWNYICVLVDLFNQKLLALVLANIKQQAL